MGGDAVRKQGFQPESGIPQRRLGRKGQVCRACERTQSKQNDLIVIITGINMSSEFFSILDLVFMFLRTLGSLKKKKGLFSSAGIERGLNRQGTDTGDEPR